MLTFFLHHPSAARSWELHLALPCVHFYFIQIPIITIITFCCFKHLHTFSPLTQYFVGTFLNWFIFAFLRAWEKILAQNTWLITAEISCNVVKCFAERKGICSCRLSFIKDKKKKQKLHYMLECLGLGLYIEGDVNSKQKWVAASWVESIWMILECFRFFTWPLA